MFPVKILCEKPVYFSVKLFLVRKVITVDRYLFHIIPLERAFQTGQHITNNTLLNLTRQRLCREIICSVLFFELR